MKVAVVGSGVSGLAATWLLNEHSDHEVHLYEADSKPGGHANTVHYLRKGQSSKGVDVDVGFIVFNPVTYPNFLRFLGLYAPETKPAGILTSLFGGKSNIDTSPGIYINPTEMTFSVSRDRGAFEWSGKNIATVFCQPRRLLDPSMWRMIYDVLRFNACARRVLLTVEGDNEFDVSIGDYLQQHGYSSMFRDNYLIPMVAAIWSTPPDKCSLDFPARTLIQFMYNHHLIQVTGRPSWLTIRGGSQNYVNQIISQLPKEQLHLSTRVISTRNVEYEDGRKPQVALKIEGGVEILYDHVILACHSDTALDILRCGGNITEDERRILSQFEWNHNETVLHHDEKLMPRSRNAWSCWNYLSFTKPASDANKDLPNSPVSTRTEIDQVSLTYFMNDLQHISESEYGPVLVTLNPPFEPDEDKILGRWKYSHPVLDSKAILAQKEMYKIQNTRSISYAGAYLKFGFHEDGFTSGLLAACSLDNNSGQSFFETASRTSTLDTVTIPTCNSTVRPPFDIQHADYHVRLRRHGFDTLLWEAAASTFDCFERTGLRKAFGMVGSLILHFFGLLLGVNRF